MEGISTKKLEIINRINAIIDEYGAFSIYDIHNSELIKLKGDKDKNLIIETFNKNYVTVGIYPLGKPFFSCPDDVFDVDYVDFDEDVLNEILYIAEYYEADNIRTQKRIAD